MIFMFYKGKFLVTFETFRFCSESLLITSGINCVYLELLILRFIVIAVSLLPYGQAATSYPAPRALQSHSSPLCLVHPILASTLHSSIFLPLLTLLVQFLSVDIDLPLLSLTSTNIMDNFYHSY